MYSLNYSNKMYLHYHLMTDKITYYHFIVIQNVYKEFIYLHLKNIDFTSHIKIINKSQKLINNIINPDMLCENYYDDTS
jgi:hypothetical protein